MLFLNGTIIQTIHYSNLFIHYAIFIRIHIGFNQSLFKYPIFNRNYSKRDFYSKLFKTRFYSKYHNVKQNVHNKKKRKKIQNN